MSDSYGSLDRARYMQIAREYGPDIASLHYYVFEGPPISDPVVIPKMGRARRANTDIALATQPPIGRISLPPLAESNGEENIKLNDEEESIVNELRAFKHWDRVLEFWEEHDKKIAKIMREELKRHGII
jgi:hypothetical protein